MIVSGLFIYPVKSAKGICVEEMSFDSLGPRFDRRFMVIDKDNKVLTQREQPSLATLITQIDFKKEELRLSFKRPKSDGEESISLPMKNDKYEEKDCIEINLWGDNVLGIDCGNDLEAFMTSFLGLKARLVFISDSRKRPVLEYENHSMSFVDSSPLLIIGEESLKDLNKRLKKPLSMNRFRPNIVLKGGDPFDEDNLKEYTLGEANLKSFKECSRCVMITIDQENGQKSDTEPLKVLNTYRSKEKGVMFGMSAFNINGKKIKKGDRLLNRSGSNC